MDGGTEMSDLQSITEFGELQTALETIAELRALLLEIQAEVNCGSDSYSMDTALEGVRFIVNKALDNSPQTIIATKESPETVLERFNRECDL